MAMDSLGSLQALVRGRWHLDRPLADRDYVQLRLIRRSVQEADRELGARVRARRAELAARSWWRTLLARGARRDLKQAIASAKALLSTSSASDGERVFHGPWQFAVAPPSAATEEALQAALAYELVGRTFAITPSARVVTIDVFEQAHDAVTGQPVSPCAASMRFDRATYDAQFHPRVDPVAAIRALFSVDATVDGRAETRDSEHPSSGRAQTSEAGVEPRVEDVAPHVRATPP